jgi:hypothetical protein
MPVKDVEINGKGLPIREFKLKWLDANAAICMIAKRRSGKSWVVRSILKYFNSLPGGTIISPTDKMSTFFGDFFPEVFIHYEYKTEIIQNILYRQKIMVDKYKAKIKEKKKVDPRAFLVMDDCLSDRGNWCKDQPIIEIFMNGRHYKLMYILTMQFPLGIKPELRSNFDFIFLLYEDMFTNQKRIYEHYAGIFPTFDSFRQVFLELTADHGCMVLVRSGSQNDLLDKVFWYKATNQTVKGIGGKQFNEFHKNNYDKNWEHKSKHINMDNFLQSKAKPKIRVDKMIGDDVKSHSEKMK